MAFSKWVTVLISCDSGPSLCSVGHVPGLGALKAYSFCRKTSSMLEVDDEGGRMFLRVLIHLTMHNYAPLVSGALQLLFKHFSQRQEAMHTFKQVLPSQEVGGGRGQASFLGVNSEEWGAERYSTVMLHSSCLAYS